MRFAMLMMVVSFLAIDGCGRSTMRGEWLKCGIVVSRVENRVVAIADVSMPVSDEARFPEQLSEFVSVQLGYIAANEWSLPYFSSVVTQLPSNLHVLILTTEFPEDRLEIVASHVKSVSYLRTDVKNQHSSTLEKIAVFDDEELPRVQRYPTVTESTDEDGP